MNLQEQLIQTFDSKDPIRKEAFDFFSTKGFPTIKEEEWKYTNLKSIVSQAYSLETATANIDINNYIIPNLSSDLLVFIDGQFAPAYSNFNNEGIIIKNLAQAITENTDTFAKHYNQTKAGDEVFTTLNTAFAQDGVYIEIAKNQTAEKFVQIVYFNTENSFNQIRNLVIIEENAEINILEHQYSLGEKSTLSNHVSEIFVGESARLNYYKIQNDSAEANLIDNTHISQAAKSLATVYTFSFNGGVIRNNLNFYHEGERLESHMYGVSLLKGNTLVDNHTFLDHKTPNCESSEWYKSIYDENSKGVFNGKVLVNRIAQKTNAYQQNDNILLSETASVDTKPQLEIFADDVKCSHGCTVGQLDETGMFYLRQRGIPQKEAKALLLYAYTSDIVEKIDEPTIKDYLNSLIANKLQVSLTF